MTIDRDANMIAGIMEKFDRVRKEDLRPSDMWARFELDGIEIIIRPKRGVKVTAGEIMTALHEIVRLEKLR